MAPEPSIIGENRYMPIEILYIIPILAIAFLAYRIVLAAQKRSEAGVAHGSTEASDAEIRQTSRSTEERLNEYERTITKINSTLSTQQKVIEKFQAENTSCADEIEKLNSQLRELHKEYDIVISENFSLRAKVKSLQRKLDDAPLAFDISPHASSSAPVPSAEEAMEMNMNLYDDTRLFNPSALLDDTKLNE
jgi:septal ring factor EnvC (AmiA/AmiB activator)